MILTISSRTPDSRIMVVMHCAKENCNPNFQKGTQTKRDKIMAWHCNGVTNREMVTKLKSAGIIGSDKAEEAMLGIDRGKYCHEADPYLDRPRRIGYNVTISAPHMHAHALTMMTEHLSRKGAHALDVGSGSGYLTACMAHMVGPGGLVVGLEHIPELVETSIKNVEQDRPDLIQNGRIKFIVGDGRLGHEPDGPYDVIHVGAAADSLPQNLLSQLAPGGRLLCPVVAVQGFQKYQDFVQVDKSQEGLITMKKLLQVMYVPLTDAKAQLANLN